MPSQQQLRWSQLRVGVTVVVASILLAILIILMSGSAGIFGGNLVIKSYFQSVEGLRVGSPVTLEGVNIGNVKSIKVVQGRQLDPVEVSMKVSKEYSFRIKKDSLASLATAGILGELFVNIESKNAKGLLAADGDTLQTQNATSIEDIVKAGQGTLQNMDVLLKRLDRIMAAVENGEGSAGKILKDPELYNRASALLSEMQQVVDSVTKGKGSIGKLLNNDELYNKINSSVDKLSKIVDDVNAGKGNAGKFLKDEQLYKNANETLAKANQLMTDVNAGKGTLGKMAHDEEFAKKIDTIVTKLAALTEQLEAGQGTTGKLFKDPSLYNNADQMLVETRALIKAIRENPKKYLTFHVKLL